TRLSNYCNIGELKMHGKVKTSSQFKALRSVNDIRTTSTIRGPEDAESQLEPFPVEVFPPALEAYCKEVAAATGTPPDFAGVTMLVVAGAGIGNSRALRIKSTWFESPRIYTAIIGDPASGKTPAATVVKPYVAFQTKALNDYKAAKE